MTTRPNVFAEGPWDFEGEKMQIRGRGVAQPAGARELGATVYELAPGASGFFLHAHYANEELFVVLTGRPTLRTHEADRELEPGEVVACPTGREGTHTFTNRSDEPARVLAISTLRFPETVVYPEEGRVFVMTRDPYGPVAAGEDEGVVATFELPGHSDPA